MFSFQVFITNKNNFIFICITVYKCHSLHRRGGCGTDEEAVGEIGFLLNKNLESVA